MKRNRIKMIVRSVFVTTVIKLVSQMSLKLVLKFFVVFETTNPAKLVFIKFHFDRPTFYSFASIVTIENSYLVNSVYQRYIQSHGPTEPRI